MSPSAGKVAGAWSLVALLVSVLVAPAGLRGAGTIATVALVAIVAVGAPAPLRGPSAALALVVTVGGYVQIGLGVAPVRVLALGVGFVVVTGAAAAVVRRVPERYSWPRFAVPLVGVGALLAACLLRYAGPVLSEGSNLANGRVVVAGQSVQAGEPAKVFVLVGFALLLPGLRTRRSTIRRRLAWLLAGGYVAPLLLLDQGPALLLVAGLLLVAAMARIDRPARSRRARLALLLGVGVVLLTVLTVPVTRAKVLGRFDAMTSPDAASQAGYARNALRQGGAVGRGLGQGQFTGTVSQRNSDLLLVVVGSELGMVALVLVTIVLLGALTRLCAIAQRTGGRRGAVATALAVTALLQAAWSCLAAVGWAPLTGVSSPFLVVTGTSVLLSAIVTGACWGAAARGELHPAEEQTSVDVVARTFRVVPLVVGVIALGFVVTAVPPTSAAQLSLPRGTIWSDDGVALARYNAQGQRIYVPLAASTNVGHYDRLTKTANGLERASGHTLTCGGSATLRERLETLVRPLPCHPADLVTTYDTGPQRAAVRALAGREGAVVLLDARNGAVLAQASTFAEHTADGPPGSTFKVVVDAAARHHRIDTSDAPLTVLDTGGERLHNIGGMTCPGTDLTTALKNSCNSVFGWVGDALGQERLRAFARRYFGTDGPVPYDGGLYRDVDLHLSTGLGNGRISPGRLARTAIGQESVRATPLGIAMMASVVLNARQGKRAPLPHVVSGTCDAGVWRARSRPGRLGSAALPSPVAEAVYNDMRVTAKGATLGRLDGQGWILAGKTGTADSPSATGTDTRSYVVLTLSARLVLVAEVYVAGAKRGNVAYPVAQQVIDALPGPDARRDEPGCR